MASSWSFFTESGGRRATSGLVVDGCRPTAANVLRWYETGQKQTTTAGCAAWGKVAIVDGPLVTVFQVDGHGRAGIAACGNAVAAVGAIQANAINAIGWSTLVKLPGGLATVKFAVAHRHTPVVQQRWDLSEIRIEIQDRSFPTAMVARITGLNDYWLASGCRDGDLPSLLHAVGDPCSTRIAAIDLDCRTPRVTFFTCGGQRRHGGTPMTGLIVLALAAKRVPWLSALSAGIETPGGFVSLPTVNTKTQICDMPPVAVQFKEIDLSESTNQTVSTGP